MDPMEAFFGHKDAYAVLDILVIGLTVAGPLIVYYWYKARRAEMELSLKHAMVERGMSAVEICAVIEPGESRKLESDQEPRAQTDYKVRV
jgi:hypothetical protein